MLTYTLLDNGTGGGGRLEPLLELTKGKSEIVANNITLMKIEKLKKIIKSHHATLDFDKDFIMKSVTVADFNFVEVVECDTVNKRPAKKRKRKL